MAYEPQPQRAVAIAASLPVEREEDGAGSAHEDAPNDAEGHGHLNEPTRCPCIAAHHLDQMVATLFTTTGKKESFNSRPRLSPDRWNWIELQEMVSDIHD
mmetsp:Transcript_15520/g.26719  ORF Transcript_15520/g.26719 Transcript_15520/m.26719 type:complete len:100 (+) Transcript_15520:653-952(+)